MEKETRQGFAYVGSTTSSGLGLGLTYEVITMDLPTFTRFKSQYMSVGMAMANQGSSLER